MTSQKSKENNTKVGSKQKSKPKQKITNYFKRSNGNDKFAAQAPVVASPSRVEVRQRRKRMDQDIVLHEIIPSQINNTQDEFGTGAVQYDWSYKDKTNEENYKPLPADQVHQLFMKAAEHDQQTKLQQKNENTGLIYSACKGTKAQQNTNVIACGSSKSLNEDDDQQDSVIVISQTQSQPNSPCTPTHLVQPGPFTDKLAINTPTSSGSFAIKRRSRTQYGASQKTSQNPDREAKKRPMDSVEKRRARKRTRRMSGGVREEQQGESGRKRKQQQLRVQLEQVADLIRSQSSLDEGIIKKLECLEEYGVDGKGTGFSSSQGKLSHGQLSNLSAHTEQDSVAHAQSGVGGSSAKQEEVQKGLSGQVAETKEDALKGEAQCSCQAQEGKENLMVNGRHVGVGGDAVQQVEGSVQQQACGKGNVGSDSDESMDNYLLQNLNFIDDITSQRISQRKQHQVHSCAAADSQTHGAPHLVKMEQQLHNSGAQQCSTLGSGTASQYGTVPMLSGESMYRTQQSITHIQSFDSGGSSTIVQGNTSSSHHPKQWNSGLYGASTAQPVDERPATNGQIKQGSVVDAEVVEHVSGHAVSDDAHTLVKGEGNGCQQRPQENNQYCARGTQGGAKGGGEGVVRHSLSDVADTRNTRVISSNSERVVAGVKRQRTGGGGSGIGDVSMCVGANDARAVFTPCDSALPASRQCRSIQSNNYVSLRAELAKLRYVVQDVNRLEHCVTVVANQERHEHSTVHVRLLHDWMDIPVAKGDVFNLIADIEIDDTGQQTACIDFSTGLFVLHPDMLFSITTIADTAQCVRKAVLKEKLSGTCSAPAALIGDLSHKLAQYALQVATDSESPQITSEQLVQYAQEVVTQCAMDLYQCGMAESDALDKLQQHIPNILTWIQANVSHQQPPGLFGLPGADQPGVKSARVNTQCVGTRVVGVSDIEESVWDPVLGIKGKLDATLLVKRNTAPARQSAPALLMHSTRSRVAPRTQGVNHSGGVQCNGGGIGPWLQQSEQAGQARSVSVVRKGGQGTDGCAQHVWDEVVLVPLEFKSGRAHFSHSAQVQLYIELLAGKYGVKGERGLRAGEFGLLWNLGDVAVKHVPRNRTAVISLIIKRSLLAAYMNSLNKEAGEKLPPMLKNAKVCKWCFENTTCAVAHAALDGGNASTSGMEPEEFAAKSANVDSDVALFVKHWCECIDLEEAGAKRGGSASERTHMWGQCAVCRERSGRQCVAGLVYGGVLAQKEGSYVYKFHKYQIYECSCCKVASKGQGAEGTAALDKGQASGGGNGKGGDWQHTFSVGDVVDISLDDVCSSLSRCIVHNISQESIDLLVHHPLHLIATPTQGVQYFLQPPTLEATSRSEQTPPGPYYRLDKDPMNNLPSLLRGFVFELAMGTSVRAGVLRSMLISKQLTRGGNELSPCVRAVLATLRALLRRKVKGDVKEVQVGDSVEAGPVGSGGSDGEHGGAVQQVCAMAKSLCANCTQGQLQGIIDGVGGSQLTCVQGMPGSGKSTVILHVIKLMIAAGKSVLLTSHTNAAVDNVLRKLVGVEYVRIGKKGVVHPDVARYCVGGALWPCDTVDEIEKCVNEVQLVACTCYGATHPLLSRMIFDLCIIDEAGQVLLPSTVPALMKSTSCMLVGDPCQLPPLVTSQQAQDKGMDVSIFQHLATSFAQRVTVLWEQFRLNQQLNDLANELVYKGQMVCATPAVQQATLTLPNPTHQTEAPHWIHPMLDPQQSLVLINTDLLGDGAFGVCSGNSWYNDAEAVLAIQAVQQLKLSGVSVTDIAIISPFVKQVALIKNKVRKYPFCCCTSGAVPPGVTRGHSPKTKNHEHGPECGACVCSIDVLTVDKCQGRDVQCVVLSLVDANQQRSPSSLIQDLRRLNVAMTRSKVKLVIIGQKQTLSNGKLTGQLIKYIADNGLEISVPKGYSAE